VLFCGNIHSVFSREPQIQLNNGITLIKSNFSNLYKWEEENYTEALEIFLKSCRKIMSLPLNNPIFPQLNDKVNKNDFYTVCRIGNVIKNYNKEYIQVFFENYFIPYEVIDKSNVSLFTGYYIPTINAKRNKDEIFKYPIYRKPDDLISGMKYYTRKEINNGILNDKNLEILYTDDFVELFFLHIQGSGNVYLADENKILSIGFDGKNNHKYSSIGKYMIKNNLINGNDGSSRGIKMELK
jgi:membrane-bound lytic murein transglycosylase A